MAKTTQTGQQKLFFVLNLIRSIKSLNRLPNEKHFNLTKSGLTYWTRKLMSDGIIKKTDKVAGLYEVLKSEEDIKKIYTKKNIVTTIKPNLNFRYKRLHSIQFQLTLPRFDYWYKILETYLEKQHIPFNKNKKNQYAITFTHKNLQHKLLLCQSSLIGYIPSGKDFISDDALHCVDMAKSYIRGLLDNFSTYFKKDLRIKGDFQFKITRKHLASMNNEIAKTLHRKNKEIKVYVNGALRVITDKSFNFDELEAITNTRAISDIEAIENHMRDVIEKKHTISDVEETLLFKLKKTQEMMLKQQEQIQFLMERETRSINIERFKY